MKAYVAKRRLLKLADLLCGLPRKRFKFSTWGEAKAAVSKGTCIQNTPHECGTTACALGWAPTLPFAKKIRIRNMFTGTLIRHTDGAGAPTGSVTSLTTFKIGDVFADSSDVSRVLFGLDRDEHTFLFMPTGYGGPSLGTNRLGAGATPKAVAKHIRKFVKAKYG